MIILYAGGYNIEHVYVCIIHNYIQHRHFENFYLYAYCIVIIATDTQLVSSTLDWFVRTVVSE